MNLTLGMRLPFLMVLFRFVALLFRRIPLMQMMILPLFMLISVNLRFVLEFPLLMVREDRPQKNQRVVIVMLPVPVHFRRVSRRWNRVIKQLTPGSAPFKARSAFDGPRRVVLAYKFRLIDLLISLGPIFSLGSGCGSKGQLMANSSDCKIEVNIPQSDDAFWPAVNDYLTAGSTPAT